MPARLVAAPPLPTPEEVAPGLEIYPRAAWAGTDREPKGELYPESVYFLLVHHTKGPIEHSETEAIVEMQEIYDYHTGPKKKWPDVAYNFFIDRYGRVFEGRAGSLKGPVMANATGGSQGFAQLVCLLGDFTNVMPTDEAQDSLARTLAWLADRHQLETGPDATTTFESRGSNKWPEGSEITVNTVSGHREVSDTTCPGETFYPVVRDELPARVSALRSGDAAAATSTSEATSTASTSTADAPASTSNPTSTTDGGSTSSSTSNPASTSTSAPATTTTAVTTSTSGATTGTATTVSESSFGSTASTSEPPVPTGGSGPASSLELFGRGALGGAAAVGVVAGVAWVINRRRENAARPDHR